MAAVLVDCLSSYKVTVDLWPFSRFSDLLVRLKCSKTSQRCHSFNIILYLFSNTKGTKFLLSIQPNLDASLDAIPAVNLTASFQSRMPL